MYARVPYARVLVVLAFSGGLLGLLGQDAAEYLESSPVEDSDAPNLLQLKTKAGAKQAAAAAGRSALGAGMQRRICTTRRQYNPRQLGVDGCDSDVLAEGTEFCINGETFSVGSSFNSAANGASGATVNLASGERFPNDLFEYGDELLVGACPGSKPPPAHPLCTTRRQYNSLQVPVVGCDSK